MKIIKVILATFLILGFLMVPSAVFALETPQGSSASLSSAASFEDSLQPLLKASSKSSSSSKIKIDTDDDDVSGEGDGGSWWIYLIIIVIIVAVILIWYFFLRK